MFMVLLKNSLQGRMHGLCFIAFESTMRKVLNFKVFMNSIIQFKYLLFWKNNNFYIARPTTKQNPCTPLYIKLSICVTFVAFGSMV